MNARPLWGWGALAALGLLAWALWPVRPGANTAVTVDPKQPGVVLRWQPGTQYAYRFAFIQDSSTVVPGLPGAPPVPAHVDIEGELHIRAYGESQGACRWACSLYRCGAMCWMCWGPTRWRMKS